MSWTDGDSLGDRATEDLRQTLVIVGFEREVARVQIADQQALAFEVTTHALAQGAHEGFELGLAGCLHALEAQAIVGGDVHTVEQQHMTNRQDSRFAQPEVAPQGWRTGMCAMQVEVEVKRTAEALDERNCAGGGGAARVPCLVQLMRGQRSIDDAEYTAHDGWTGGEEKPQGMREGHDPLTDRDIGQDVIDQ